MHKKYCVVIKKNLDCIIPHACTKRIEKLKFCVKMCTYFATFFHTQEIPFQ